MGDGMGVLLVGNFHLGGLGSRNVGEDLAAVLAQQGWRVFTTSSQRGRIPRMIGMLLAAWDWRRRYRFAVVEVYSGAAFFWAELVCWSLAVWRVPCVLSLHGGRLPEFARHSPRRVARLVESASAVTAPSCYLQEALKHVREDIVLVPNPLDVSAYPFRRRSPARPRLVWLRAFHRIYNPALAPAVLARLLAGYGDASLTMIGPDKGDGSLEETRAAASRLGVLDRITFTGPVAKSAVPAWLDRHDVFLNTTNCDNAPVSLLEAMCAGLCIVTTNVGGIAHLVRDGETALCVPPDDAGAMANAVTRILREPALAGSLSMQGRHAAEHFDYRYFRSNWRQVVATALSATRNAENR